VHKFKLVSKFKPAGDQPEAIKQLVENIQGVGSKEWRVGSKKNLITSIHQNISTSERHSSHQVLLGVTGSGKTFTIANVIEQINKPTLVISHNKTLAAQVYSEFKAFFPHNAVEYFISYYDYYQPESYIPQTDTYIEKDASINEHIDRLRIKTTTSLLSRTDVIVVASVSSIYNLGSPEDFKDMCVVLEKDKTVNRNFLLNELINIHYERNDIEFIRGKFRVRGNLIDIFPANSETAIRIEFFGDKIEKITEINPITGHSIALRHPPAGGGGRTIAPATSNTDSFLPTNGSVVGADRESLAGKQYFIYPAKHFVTPRPQLEKAVQEIRKELKVRVEFLKKEGKLLEAQRIEQRTNYDLEMMLELGYCHGIENYSRHLSGRKPGSRPSCLIDYFPKDFLTVIDESHVTIPQIYGMYKGDKARKQTLIDFGFRLPSALDNRPQKLEEFESLVDNVIYMSATPSEYELKASKGSIVEQIVRPTGLIDPVVTVKPLENQIEDLISEIEKCVIKKERVLVTTLTKKMAEDLAEYLFEKKIKVKYLHSGIQALERIEILSDLRKGNFDVLVGVNLLREGLDLPEVSLVAVLDADKEGFLRSETSLIQVSGRAARNINGKVVLYAENVTGSMKRALSEMTRRRKKQVAYNIKHNIKPKSIIKAIEELQEFQYKATKDSLSLLREDWVKYAQKKNIPELIRELEKEMNDAADNLNFELAAILRDKIFELKEMSVKK